MKTARARFSSVLILAFLLVPCGGFFTTCQGFTVLSQSREVTVDHDWQISGSYHYTYEIRTERGGIALREHLDGLVERTEYIKVEVDGTGASRGDWPVSGPPLSSGSTVGVWYRVEMGNPGLGSLLADVFSAGKPQALQDVQYSITFPSEIPFRYRVVQNGLIRGGDTASDGFSVTAEKVETVDIMVTTALDWEMVYDRYRDLYHARYQEGLSPESTPSLIRDIKGFEETRIVTAVLEYLKGHIEYRTNPDIEGGLLPGTPDAVMSRGWGDCKDLALLAVVLLRKAGVDASIVLTGDTKEYWPCGLPDPYAYSHAMIALGDGEGYQFHDLVSRPSAKRSSDVCNSKHVLILDVHNRQADARYCAGQ